MVAILNAAKSCDEGGVIVVVGCFALFWARIKLFENLAKRNPFAQSDFSANIGSLRLVSLYYRLKSMTGTSFIPALLLFCLGVFV